MPSLTIGSGSSSKELRRECGSWKWLQVDSTTNDDDSLQIAQSALHHQQIVLHVVYHVQLGLVVKLRLNVDVVLLSKHLRDEWRRVEALACRWHHEWARVVARGDALVLLKGRERVMMVQIDNRMCRRRQLERLARRMMRVRSEVVVVVSLTENWSLNGANE